MNTRAQIKRLIQPTVQSMSAYQVPSSAGLIKLDAMENPYHWPEDLRQAWLAELAAAAINRYPDADAQALKQQLGAVFAVPEGAQLLLGNGSDEIIQLLVLSMARPGLVVMTPEPSFAMYKMATQIVAAQFVGVPLRADDFSFDLEATLAAITQHQPSIIFLAWPNNPTGNLFDTAAISEVIEQAPGIVVLDEAYQAFAKRSFMPLLKKYENLMVMRTLSKLGLAGLRLGFLAGHPAWVSEFEKLRMPYNIGVLTQTSVAFILKHIEVLNEQAARLCADRDRMFEDLAALPGVRVWPSAANFLLLRMENRGADEVYEKLKRQGILVKNLHAAHAMLNNCLRITIGKQEENKALLAALKNCI